MLAVKRGEGEVPVTYVDLGEEEERRVIALYDRITGLAGIDDEKWKELMGIIVKESGVLDSVLDGMLAELAVEAGVLMEGMEEDEEGVGKAIDEADLLREKWGVEEGQLWRLGRHYLICGDCTDAEVVRKVMDGKAADLGMHDPPYGIDAPNMTLGLGKKEFKREDFDRERVDISHLIGASKLCAIWGGNYYTDVLPVSNDWLCWDKKNPNMGYSEFELAWSNFGKNTRIINHHWSGEEKVHPTQKPLPVIEWCLGLVEGDVVVDFYLGSGTTLIACERLGRECHGVEISPAYVSVALQRFYDYTGVTPVLGG
jgi:DNA modification methylase